MRREAYAGALNSALEVFVSNTDGSIGAAMSNGLHFIADAAEIDRIIVFRSFDAKKAEAGEIYRWDKALGGAVPIDETLRALPVTTTIRAWLSVMKEDTCVALRRSEFKEGEASFLSPRDVKSILIVPVFTERKLWAVVTFHDNTNERGFDEGCTAMLRSAARLCVSAIIRDEKTSSADRALESLLQREKMLGILNEVSGAILQAGLGSFDSSLLNCLGILAEAADADRVYIFKNHSVKGELCCTQAYEWSEGAPPQHGGIYTSDIPYSSLPGWEEALSQGKCINSLVRNMPEAEQAALAPQGILSILVDPIFLNNRFWGFVGYDDCSKERAFSHADEMMLRSASKLIANALLSNEDARNAKEADERVRLMLDATPLSCQLWDENAKIIDCNREALKLYGLRDKREYLDRYFDLMPKNQPDGSLSREKTVKMVKAALKRGRVVYDWVHRKPGGELIPAEITLVQVDLGEGRKGIAGYTRDLRATLAAEAKIVEAEKRLQIMMDATPLACTMWDGSFKKIGCNFEMASLFGFSSKQDYLEGRYEYEPELQPDGARSGEKTLEVLKKAFKDGHCASEWMFKTADGDPLPVQMTLVRVDLGASDQIVMSYMKDLRDIKDAEARAKDAEKRLQVMMDATPLACSIWDEHCNKIGCNFETVRLLGLSGKQEYMGGNCQYEPEFQPDGEPSNKKSVEILKKAFSEGTASFEWMFKTTDGEPLPVQLTLVRVDLDKNDRFLMSYMKDLREIKDAEARAKEAEKHLQVIMDTSPMACIIWDENLNRVDCNVETVKLFEISKKEDFLSSFNDFSPDFQPDGQHSEMKANKKLQAALNGGYQIFEWTHKTANGALIPSEVTLVRVEAGNRKMIMSYVKDLREIKASEAQAEEANERAQMMFNAMPHGCVYWDKNANIIDCNNELFNMLDLPNKQESLDRFFEFSPEHQPDRSLSINKAKECLDYAFDRGRITFEWLFKGSGGNLVPIEITLIRARRDNESVVIGYVRDLREIKEKTAQLDMAEKLAFTDPLTGAYNRRYFITYAENEFGLPDNAALQIGVVMLDLDFFKKVNDTYGHEAGDGVLKLVAATARGALRESDIFARFGGEEFIIFVKALLKENIISLVERIRKKIEKIDFVYDGQKISITASAGISFRADAAQPLDDVIKQADKALYQAKENGRNRYEVYSE
jgi:diguanylate cyclase (GGDEF)-like protein/PAS domain S-box-containing protein